MEPSEQKPQFGAELPPSQFENNPEQFPGGPPPESAPESQPERREQSPAEPADRPPAEPAAAPALPPVVQPATDDNAAADKPVTGDNPTAANDDDLIEREWVDKAKKIIDQTKDDPYRREMEVSKLQADYLYKRYGRELESPQ